MRANITSNYGARDFGSEYGDLLANVCAIGDPSQLPSRNTELIMKVLLFACADSASLDARSNRLSLFHLTEELNAAAFPAIQPTMSVIAIVERSAQEPQRASLLITGELNGKQIFSLPFAIEFQTHMKARAIADIQGLPGIMAQLPQEV